MPSLRRADKIVVLDSQFVPQRPIFPGDPIHKFLGSDARCLRRALNLLPVLIGAGQEESVGAQKPLPARNRVAGNRRIRVPDVRARIHVVNRGRNVELSFHDVACGLCAKM